MPTKNMPLKARVQTYAFTKENKDFYVYAVFIRFITHLYLWELMCLHGSM